MRTATRLGIKGRTPTWTLGDKLRKARTSAGLEQVDLANELGIARNSVANYENGRTTPRRAVLLAWALCTGVSLDWLTEDDTPPTDGDAGWAPRGSNPEPADYKNHSSRSVVTRRSDVTVPRPLLPRRRPAVPAEPRKAAA